MVVIVILWVEHQLKQLIDLGAWTTIWLVYDQIHFSGLWMIMDFIPLYFNLF